MSLSDEAVSKIHKYECVTELENNVLQLNASNNRSTSCFPEFSVFFLHFDQKNRFILGCFCGGLAVVTI